MSPHSAGVFVRTTLACLAWGAVCAPARAAESASSRIEFGSIRVSVPTDPVVETRGGQSRSAPDTSLTTEYLRNLLHAELSGLVEIDSVQMRRPYLVGDFNADGEDDIAIVAQLGTSTAPGGRPPRLRAYVPLGTSMRAERSSLRISNEQLVRWRGELVPAVIHSFREPMRARRPDNAIVLFPVRSQSELRRFRGLLKVTIAGDEPEPIQPPVLRGDAILLLYDDGTGAAVYWDGERYRWYPYDPAGMRPADG